MALRSVPVTYGTTNAAFGWAVIAVLVAVAVERVLAGELLWAGMAAAVAAVGVVPPTVTRRPTEMIAWEVLGLAAFPAVARSFGLFAGSAAYFSVAALALVVAVELDAYTSVEMSSGFAVAFVVIVTMAVAGLWTIAQYASDSYLGTSFLVSQNALMWDLVAATGVGTVSGIVFELYFRRLSPGHGITLERGGRVR